VSASVIDAVSSSSTRCPTADGSTGVELFRA
jgi:hypothetical protein